MDSTKPNTIILKFYHYQNFFNDFRLHVVLNKYSVIREAFVGRGFEFNDRDPNLMGNKYEDFSDGKHNNSVADPGGAEGAMPPQPCRNKS